MFAKEGIVTSPEHCSLQSCTSHHAQLVYLHAQTTDFSLQSLPSAQRIRLCLDCLILAVWVHDHDASFRRKMGTCRKRTSQLTRHEDAACAATAKFLTIRKIPLWQARAAAWGAWHTAHPVSSPHSHKRTNWYTDHNGQKCDSRHMNVF